MGSLKDGYVLVDACVASTTRRMNMKAEGRKNDELEDTTCTCVKKSYVGGV
jgi:hypothetical protein